MRKMDINQDYLKDRILYLPDTGDFFFRERPDFHFKSHRAYKAWNARFAGVKTGSMDGRGYLQVKIDGVRHLAHRLAFIYQTGSCPDLIDHIDRVKTNNSWINLRPATRSENAANSKPGDSKGVFLRSSGKYSAQICVNYKIKHLGTFDKKSEAKAAYQKAAELSFGDFANERGLMG